MKRLVTGLILCGALVASSALAVQLTGVGSPFFAMRRALTTATNCIPTTSGGSTCALFASNDVTSDLSSHVAVIAADDDARCCWSQDPALSLVSNQLALSDAGGPNGTGPCSGFSLSPTAGTGRRDSRPSRVDILARSGARSGLCSVAVTTTGVSLYAPCDADGDCSSYGGGTCTTSPSTTQLARAGAFLLCTAAATADVDVVWEAVRQ